MTSPGKPLLIFDGECGFCRRLAARGRRVLGERVDLAPYQEVAASHPDIPRQRFAETIHLVEPDGRWSTGAEAVFRALAHAPRGGLWLAVYQRVPGFAPVSEWCYRLVARHRGRL